MNSKLVRNLIPIIFSKEKKEDGSQRVAQYYRANDREYWIKLKEKLLEEAMEFIDSEETVELADILEVIEAITIYKKISSEDLVTIKNNKAKSHGTFSEKIILSFIDD